MMDRFLGASTAVTTVANAATGMAEVFRENSTRRMELDEEAYARAMMQMSGEFAAQPRGWFDGIMNGLNRLPRPMMTMGTVGLFVYAMVEPVGFGLRMENLNLVPEPLWWLLGAIISFYFGAREAHYFRTQPRFPRQPKASTPTTASFDDNPALRDWAAETAAR